MSRRNLFASMLMACLLAIGLGGHASVANAASAGQSILKQKPGQSAGNDVVEVGYRGHGPRIYLRTGPSYSGYDYPYYYNRGYYPRHIGPGYVYNYPIYEYSYRPAYSPRAYSRSGGRCSYWHRRCVANWGGGNEDYDGCMDYHRCQ